MLMLAVFLSPVGTTAAWDRMLFLCLGWHSGVGEERKSTLLTV